MCHHTIHLCSDTYTCQHERRALNTHTHTHTQTHTHTHTQIPSEFRQTVLSEAAYEDDEGPRELRGLKHSLCAGSRFTVLYMKDNFQLYTCTLRCLPRVCVCVCMCECRLSRSLSLCVCLCTCVCVCVCV